MMHNATQADCKQGPTQDTMGDCPFTMKANMALRVKGLEPKIAYVDLGNKPQWFLDLNSKGSAPTYISASGERGGHIWHSMYVQACMHIPTLAGMLNASGHALPHMVQSKNTDAQMRVCRGGVDRV